MSARVQRRQLITLLGGAATWPYAAWAQQPARMRRIGVLLGLAADDPIDQARAATFAQGLQQAGWTIGRNVQPSSWRRVVPIEPSLRELRLIY